MPPTAEPGTPPLVTVLVPVHNHAGTLDELCDQVHVALDAAGHSHEVLFVDDASTDTSWRVISALAAADDRVRGVRLAFNVGGGTARAAGCEVAAGSYICTIDADLDYHPSDLVGVIDLLVAGNEFVSGVRVDASGKPLNRKLGSVLLRRVLARTWSFTPRDFGCGLQGWTAELAAVALPYVTTHRDFLWAVPLFTPAQSYAELEVRHHNTSRSSYPLLRLVGRLGALAVGVWRTMAAALLVAGLGALATAVAGGIGSAIWWAVGGPVWPAVTAAAVGAWVGLPLTLTGVVLIRLDRLTAAAEPPWIVRSSTPSRDW